MSKKQPKFKVGETVYFFEYGKIKSGKIERVRDLEDFPWPKDNSRFHYNFNDKGIVFGKSQKECFKTEVKCAKNSVSRAKNEISCYKKEIKNQEKGLNFWVDSLNKLNEIIDKGN